MVFPDICDPVLQTFEPTEAHEEFSKKYGVGVALMHSHDGFCENLLFSNFTKGRPPTEHEKSEATPCSFFLDENDALVANEWTLDAAGLRPMPQDLQEITAALKDLMKISGGLALGFTVRPYGDWMYELEVEGKPGHHVYVTEADQAQLFPDLKFTDNPDVTKICSMIR